MILKFRNAQPAAALTQQQAGHYAAFIAKTSRK
jgi:hypothetical protein